MIGADGRRARLLVAALLSLVLAWSVAPALSPPLYDGLGFPDEPYRFVQPPGGYQRTPAPTAASYKARVDTRGAQIAQIYDLSTDELGPQAELIVRQEDVDLPTGAGVVSLHIEPLAARTQPADGVVWGNVYRVSAASDTGKGSIRPDGHTDQIRLRAPTGPPPTPGIEFYNGSTWRRLSAARIGNDLYVGRLAGVGDYALVIPPGSARVSAAATPAGGGSAPTSATASPGASSVPPVGSDTAGARSTTSGTARTLLAIFGGAVVLAAGLVIAVRFSRRRPST